MKNLFQKLALIGLFFFLSVASSQASVTANSVITPQTPNRGVVQFLQGTDSAGTYKTLYTAGANGSKIVGLSMNNNDAGATHLVTCQIVNSTVKYGGVALTSTSSAGFVSGTNGQNLLSATLFPGGFTDANGNYALILVSGDTLQCTFATALTSTDVLNVIATAMDY